MTWAVPSWWAFSLLVVAAWRTWRLLAHDQILDWLRHRLIKAESKTEEFLQCAFCAGAWVAAAWWVGWLITPHWSVVAAVPFAFSAVLALLEINLGPD